MTATLPFHAPDRPRPRLRLVKALQHFRQLMRDPEDTVQVFYMTECLPSKKAQIAAEQFCASEHGLKLISAEPRLPEILDDHDSLLKMPGNSVAHAYVAFMRKEKLSAAGLVEVSTAPDLAEYPDGFQWFNDRIRDTHDLAHILTGYGRDPLGEQCVLGFTSGQYRDWTETIIAWAGTAEFALRSKTDAPFIKAVAQARGHGKAAHAIYKQDIRALLREPLDAARARMGIAEPTLYHRAHERLRAHGIDPYQIGGPAALAA